MLPWTVSQSESTNSGAAVQKRVKHVKCKDKSVPGAKTIDGSEKFGSNVQRLNKRKDPIDQKSYSSIEIKEKQ